MSRKTIKNLSTVFVPSVETVPQLEDAQKPMAQRTSMKELAERLAENNGTGADFDLDRHRITTTIYSNPQEKEFVRLLPPGLTSAQYPGAVPLLAKIELDPETRKPKSLEICDDDHKLLEAKAVFGPGDEFEMDWYAASVQNPNEGKAIHAKVSPEGFEETVDLVTNEESSGSPVRVFDVWEDRMPPIGPGGSTDHIDLGAGWDSSPRKLVVDGKEYGVAMRQGSTLNGASFTRFDVNVEQFPAEGRYTGTVELEKGRKVKVEFNVRFAV
jgi:hypothetical protein